MEIRKVWMDCSDVEKMASRCRCKDLLPHPTLWPPFCWPVVGMHDGPHISSSSQRLPVQDETPGPVKSSSGNGDVAVEYHLSCVEIQRLARLACEYFSYFVWVSPTFQRGERSHNPLTVCSVLDFSSGPLTAVSALHPAGPLGNNDER